MSHHQRFERITMGPGNEFDRVRRILHRASGELPEHVRVGPGDDAAVLDTDSVVVSTDLSVEDVHFRRSWLTPAEIGYRAVTAALSDLAAMAAQPLGVLVSMALPGEEWDAALDDLAAGVADACDAVGAPLIGGDLTSSSGPLILDVTVLGRAPTPVLRLGAEPDDEVWVTGVLGASGGAVRSWQRDLEPPPALRAAYARPTARLAEALWLAEQVKPRAMVDVSDGLRGDVGHLAHASDVSVTLSEWLLPVDPVLTEAFGPDEAVELALGAGEDYELCFAAAPGTVEPRADEFKARFGVGLTRVGTVGVGSGVYIRPGLAEGARQAEEGGFDHFAAKRET
jgi:thiamine-monophosphate kinase